jgi:hypothetical protein
MIRMRTERARLLWLQVPWPFPFTMVQSQPSGLSIRVPAMLRQKSSAGTLLSLHLDFVLTVKCVSIFPWHCLEFDPTPGD